MKRRDFIGYVGFGILHAQGRDAKLAEHNKITAKLNKLGDEAVKTIGKLNARAKYITDVNVVDAETIRDYRKLANLYNQISELFLQLAAL